ncbi:hypothetical protein PVK06_004653 [Gossypium arboreum]|uniref:Uncharacterized protein n=1 Tax=Gossypium arboreum TaxID=29729 RepID=A0ABR0QTJ2_GOSAR|nr:hypothetical protein PVK06_004653 [Gossypium arboreum]
MIMRENEWILNGIKRRKREIKEKKIESEKAYEQGKETEKESEVEERKDSEGETSEKDEREQEKVRNVFTNQQVSFPRVVSSFQVSKESIDKFQLQYLYDERRFRLIEKVIGSNFANFINQGGYDLERFFASKWPDLRTNHLQEGGNDAILATSCYDLNQRHREWSKHEGPKCKMELNFSSMSSILVFTQLNRAQFGLMLAH